jgi:hypothetical protein
VRGGEQVGCGRVERLIRSNGIQGAKRREKPCRTTQLQDRADPRPRLAYLHPAELAVVEYVAWFNTERLHTSLGGVPPVEFEERHA